MPVTDNSIDAAAIDKASSLVEALSYIQRFHNKVVVVKVGGSIMDDEKALTDLLNDIVFMNYVGMQPILVHGGGKAINQAMETAGIQPQMVMGRRYTDERDAGDCRACAVQSDQRVHREFHSGAGLRGDGAPFAFQRRAVCGENLSEGPDGRRIDLGLVGDVTTVNARLLQLLVQADSIPCIATIARDAAGNKLNVNADTAAGAVAAAMKAEKLVVVSDTHGIRTSRAIPTSLVRHLTDRSDRRAGEKRCHHQRHASEGGGLRHRPSGRREQNTHHRRPNSPRSLAGNLHRSRHRDRDRAVGHEALHRHRRLHVARIGTHSWKWPRSSRRNIGPNRRNDPILAGKTLAMIFEKPSLRTRVSFAVAMTHLGGNGLLLRDEEVGLGKREPVQDVARVLSGMCDGIMARTFAHEKIV